MSPALDPHMRALWRASLLSGCVSVAIAVAGAIVGGLVVGWNGVWSSLSAGFIALLLVGITAASIRLLARSAGKPSYPAALLGFVFGGWVLKLALFLGFAIGLDGQPWIDPTVLFLVLIAAVIASLAVDVVTVARARLPYV